VQKNLDRFKIMNVNAVLVSLFLLRKYQNCYTGLESQLIVILFSVHVTSLFLVICSFVKDVK